MTTKTNITLLPCPCCGVAARMSDDYENSDGEPAVECSSCNLLSWTVEDWNRRAAVEAEAYCADGVDPEPLVLGADHFRGVTEMVPSDEELLGLLQTCGALTTAAGIRAIRVALSRYSSGQPAAATADYERGRADGWAAGWDEAHGRPAASAEPYAYIRTIDLGNGNTQVDLIHADIVGDLSQYTDIVSFEPLFRRAAPVAQEPDATGEYAAFEKWLGARADDTTLPRGLMRDAFCAGVEAGRQDHFPGATKMMPSDDDIVAACKSLGWDLDAQAQPDVSLTSDMQRESQRGAESGRDHDTALADTQRYRWLKENAFCNVWGRGDGIALVVPRTTINGIDAAIDAARVAKGADHG